MSNAIFLSASVPDPSRARKYAETADMVAITSAVSALLFVTLGRRRIIWGGHPAITPMIWIVSQGIGVDYASWVKLYQSRYFEEVFPEENARFQNVSFTENMEGDRDKSLLLMRQAMFTENTFEAAVFIGGMGGIAEEYELFRQYQPDATILPVVSTGGATLEVADRLGSLSQDLADDRDYVALFHRHLGISVKEERFWRRHEQPAVVEERYWRPRA